ncbi:hypothetical protein [Kitasatospora sp. NBC_00458]|uniref:hypothetical protein n=1 Tax=Kitasatospora sp. NBC_00458 TaxID=2903568 RepID=UPI002E17D29C
MNSVGKMRTALLVTAAAVVPVALGSWAGWPVWLWVVLAVGIALPVLLTSATRVRPATAGPQRVPSAAPVAGPPPVQVAPVELPYHETVVSGVALPSAVPDYDFVFSATVWWRPVPNGSGLVHAAPGSLAIEMVLARARAVTEREHPGRLDLVRHRLDGVLGTQSPDTSGLVVAMAGRVSLGLPEADRDRLGKLAEVRKAEEVWEHERRYERSKRAYLGEDVLSSPGRAVVWWLSRHDEEVQGAVDMIGPLAQLSAAANDRAVDGLYEHLVARKSPQGIPFLDDVAPRAGEGHDEGSEATGWGAPPPGHVGPSGLSRGPAVIGPLSDLMDDVDLAEEVERTVYAHRVARLTEAAGRPEAAALILESLSGSGLAAPHSAPDFVAGRVRPVESEEADEGVGSIERVEGTRDSSATAWEPGAGAEPGVAGVSAQGWGGADQSHR